MTPAREQMEPNCPLCEKGTLSSATVRETLNYADARLEVDGIEISICAVCCRELVLPEQLKGNERRFADAKRAHDNRSRSYESD